MSFLGKIKPRQIHRIHSKCNFWAAFTLLQTIISQKIIFKKRVDEPKTDRNRPER